MADVFKSIKITQPQPGGPLVEQVVGVVYATGVTPPFPPSTSPDGYKIVALGPNGTIDPSLISSSSSISVNGVAVSNPNFQDDTSVTWAHDVSGNVHATTVGLATDSGVVNINGNHPLHQGQLLIAQGSGPNTTALWADPFVQGPWINGTAVVSPGAMGDGTSNIQPVFVAGYDGTDMRGLLTDTSGRLIVIGSLTHNNATPASNNVGVLPAVASMSSPTYSGGDQVLLSTDLQGNLRVTSSGSFTPALTADRTATGTITSNQNVGVSTAGGGTLVFNILGTWTGTIVFEASVDGTNWVTANAVPYQGAVPGGTNTSTATANGQWFVGIGGINAFRVRGNTVTSGTATVWIEVGAGSNAILVSDIVQGSVSVSNTVTVSGTIDVTAISVPIPAGTNIIGQVEVTDGVNGIAAVKPANTAAVATDKALVVAVSPNNIITTNIEASSTALTATGSSLNVNITGGASSGTQYLEGTTVATPTGTAAMGKNPSNVIETLRLDASNNLLTSTVLATGSNIIGKVEVTDGTNILFTSAHPGFTTDAADGLTGANVPATAIFAGGVGSDGHLHGLSTDNSGVLNVNASVSGSFTPALTQDNTNSGTINAVSQTLSLPPHGTQGTSSTVFNITGTWSGTIVFEVTVDGTNWYPVFAYAKFPSGVAVQSTTTNGQWQLPSGGVNNFRVRSSAWTSGTATIWIEAGAGPLLVEVGQVTASNLNATVAQGTAASFAAAWPVFVSDGANKLLTSSFPGYIQGTVSLATYTIPSIPANPTDIVGYQLPAYSSTNTRLSQTAISFSSSSPQTLVPGVALQSLRIWRLIFNVGGSTTLTIGDTTPTAFSGPFTFTTAGGMVLDLSGEPWYVCGIGQGFTFTTSAAVQVGGTIWWTRS